MSQPHSFKRHRILYVNNSADVYGASRCLLRIVRILDRERFEPIVLLPERGPLVEAVQALDVKVIFFPQLSVITRNVFGTWQLLPFALRFPASLVSLWRILKGERIDLVHTNTGVILSSGPAAWLAGVPHVFHVRDWFQEFRGFWKYYAWGQWVFSTRIIAVSRSVAEQFPPSYNVSVVHDGIEVEEFAHTEPTAGAKFRIQYALGDGQVAGCVGRIKLVRKGQEVLVQAAILLKQRGVRGKYLFVGAPYSENESHLEKLRTLVRAADLDDDVVFTGELLDTRPAYAAMNVFVLPSAQTEPFGGVVTEAMCAEIPVIATNIGGPCEQVIEGETGYLVPPGDASALADKLEVLFRDSDLQKRMGAAGRERAQRCFRLKEMVGKIERIYEECLAPR